MNIEFRRLHEIERTEITALMNHPLVRRHMPLSKDHFDDGDCEALIAAKERLWSEHGYGPWAFVLDGRFVGWGGLQPENGDADLALVLHPAHWGIGKMLYIKIIDRAFGEMGLDTVTVLLPLTRRKGRTLMRLGFAEDGFLEIRNEPFARYRLAKGRTTKFQ